MPAPGKVVVLDRDGVINEDSDVYIKSPDEWRALPGSLEAIARLNAAGYQVVVATNQSGVGRGLFSMQTLDAIHDRMKSAVADAGGDIAGVYVCPHRPNEGCSCRKPLPGLLQRIGEDFGVAAADMALVGDKLTDMQAAEAVGARPLFVTSGGRDEDRRRVEELGIEVHADLASAVEALLDQVEHATARATAGAARDSVERQPLRQWFNSIAFTTFLFLSVVVYAPIVLLSAPFGHAISYRTVEIWIAAVLYMLKRLCELDHVVEGREHLPSENTVVLMKHSSAWETIAQWTLFPKQTWVLKRELLWVPFFGWVLPQLRPIAIDRRGGRSAVQQVVDQGLDRLRNGFWIVIFPEGTRVPFGQTRRFGLSGAVLACAAGKPIVPVAHDAGYFWPRRGWLKKAGTIRVRIGPPIPTEGRDARDVTAEAQRWIEETLASMRQHRPAAGTSPTAAARDAREA